MRRAAIALLLALGAVVLTAPVASAHSELLSSSPARDGVLAEPPTEVVLTFSTAVQSTGAAVVVTTADGTRLDDGPVRRDGARMIQRVKAGSGAVDVRWRAVSEDGHQLTGTFGYAVGAPAGAAGVEATPTPPAGQQAVAPAPDVQSSAAEPSPLYRRLLGPAALVIAALALAVAAWRSGRHSKTNELVSKEQQS
ncbi:copper resistance CopC family protein [Rhodococcus sp. UNC363MFTsu5.1]|uniref:copper resistance CopC family protein n=1 Tax=Rhodococcus sp. UNC363MFTsu5.1 TaxID=1449069 RepID=UPI00068E713C|nr:copper resistance CopC family protein [Rhodococcus sp. UNC363MFTsu5.1]